MRTSKSIGIEQRIPLQVLDNAIIYNLKGIIDIKTEIVRDLSEHFTGVNRIGKSYAVFRKILFTSKTSIFFFKNCTLDKYLSLSEPDRKAVWLSLLSAAYPFVYELISEFAESLKTQSVVNMLSISNRMKSIYGSNRTLDMGLYATIPILIELGLITRPKNAIYAKGIKLKVVDNLVKEMLILSDLEGSYTKIFALTDVDKKPYFSFLEMTINTSDIFSTMQFRGEGKIKYLILQLNQN